MESEQIKLACESERLFIGGGRHKKTYIDPRDPRRCIKVAFEEHDIDEERELCYRKARALQHQESSFLPCYYGVVQTDLGVGYVYDRVQNYDGTKAATLEDLIKRVEWEPTPEKRAWLLDILLAFGRVFLTEDVAVTNVEAANFMAYKKDAGEGAESYGFRVVDNIGTHTKLPLIFFNHAVRHAHTVRYWRRFVHESGALFQGAFTEEMLARLLALAEEYK